MTKYNSTVCDASDGRAAVGFFAAQARHTAGRDGVGSFPWSILAELGQLSQPGWYGEHNTQNLQKTAAKMKAEKQAVGHGVGSNRVIPWLSTATGGYVSPTSCFDELVHMFLNGASNCLYTPCTRVVLIVPRTGASGFSYYSDSDFHDMQYFVSIADAMRLLVPYEDLIIDGALAPFTSSSGCVASAMGLAGTYLIGVTPLDLTVPVSFAFHGAGAGPHELVDVGTGKVQRVASADVAVTATLAKTTVYRFAPAE